MTEPSIVKDKPKRVFLVGIKDNTMSGDEAESLGRELEGLVKTLGLEIAGQETVNVRERTAQFGMGTGKAEELAEKAALLELDCIVFDREISPSQQRNWENLTGLSVIDRQELIIQIFASRARTREAELQVNLAELVYALPRLRHKYINLSRQRGGRYGTRGSGETFLETDRRRLEQRIRRLEDELEEVKRQRQIQRKQRERQGVSVCALVGYTNAGKSTIFNALSGASMLTEDKLFATLDAVSRRLDLPAGMQVLLVDTVGFLRRLPHSLINAFRSTLEEACRADLLIHVLDAHDADVLKQHETTLSVLGELGAGSIPMITVLNKIDLLDGEDAGKDGAAFNSLDSLKKFFPDSIPVSALDSSSGPPRGLDELLLRIEGMLSKASKRYRFPPERTDLAALLHRSGQVISEEYGDNFIDMEARTEDRIAGRLKEYQVNE